MKIHQYLILIICVSLIGACDYNDNRLKIKNNGNHAVAFEYSLDTILDKETNNISFYIRDKILPGAIVSKSKPGSTQGWTFVIQNSNNKKLNIFIINIDTLLKYNDWEYIRNHKLYKRYSLTEEELKKLDWIIEYP
jgi:hypothetical protein